MNQFDLVFEDIESNSFYESVCIKTWTLSTRARFVTKTHTAIVRTTETTATICNCHYNCCLHSCTDGRYSLELYLNCTQQTNQNCFAAAFFLLLLFILHVKIQRRLVRWMSTQQLFSVCAQRCLGSWEENTECMRCTALTAVYFLYTSVGCEWRVAFALRYMLLVVVVVVVFFFCFLWKYRFCVQAKTHLKLFVPPTEKQAFHFWQRSFSGCSYPCSLYPMTLCVTLRRRGSMIFSSVTFVWMEIKACARWHAHFCNTRVLLVQRIFKCSCNASSCDEQ